MRKNLEKFLKPLAVVTFFIGIGEKGIANTMPPKDTSSVRINGLLSNKKIFTSSSKHFTDPLAALSNTTTYCSSFASSGAYENISRVQLDSEGNTSSATTGYEDFTGLGAASLVRGGSKTITITPSWPMGFISNAGYNYGVWIDYNNDGDFNDAGERVLTRNATRDASISGVFTVPSTSPLVTGARMRVIMSDATTSTSLSPCGSVSPGQVEDYAISVFDNVMVSDVTPPTTPTLNSPTGVTSVSVNLVWSTSTDNIGVTGYDIFRNGSLIASTTGATSYTVTNLSPSTAYTFVVKAKDAAGNISSASNSQTITTSSANATSYCSSFASSAAGENISKVVISYTGNISFATTGYEDFTYVTAGVIIGTTVPIEITPNWPTGFVSNAGYNYSVWIDYNKNNRFDDLGEKVFSVTASKETLISGSFTVPTTVMLGSTRVRVSMSDATQNATLSPCGSVSPGQVEDYTVVISSNVASSDVTPPTAPVLTASGISSTTVNLSWTAATDNVGVTSYDIFQGSTLIKNTTAKTYAVTGLLANSNYSFTVKAKDAAGNSSVASNAALVKTLSNNVVTTDVTPPTPPTLTASGVSVNSVNLSWTAATDNIGVTSYDIFKGNMLIKNTTARTYAVTGLLANSNYPFTVKAKDAAGNSSISSNVAFVRTLSNDSVPTATDVTTIAYPNPTDGILQLANPNTIITAITVKNAIGTPLLTTQVNSNNAVVNLIQFGSGIYFIEVILGTKIEILRVIRL